MNEIKERQWWFALKMICERTGLSWDDIWSEAGDKAVEEWDLNRARAYTCKSTGRVWKSTGRALRGSQVRSRRG